MCLVGYCRLEMGVVSNGLRNWGFFVEYYQKGNTFEKYPTIENDKRNSSRFNTTYQITQTS